MSQPSRSSTVVKSRAGKYHDGNHPMNLEDARSRLSEVQAVTNQIESRLEYCSKDDFSADSRVTFNQWMSKTTKALGYWRSERDFLLRWIRLTENLFITDVDTLTASERGLLEGDFSSRIENALLYISSRYTPRYSANNPPQSSSALNHQVRNIQHVLQRMQTIFAGLHDAAKVYGVSEEEMRLMIKPVGDLMQSAQEEARFLNISGRSAGKADLASILVVIDRAIAGGFTLSDQEQGIVGEIRKKIALK